MASNVQPSSSAQRPRWIDPGGVRITVGSFGSAPSTEAAHCEIYYPIRTFITVDQLLGHSILSNLIPIRLHPPMSLKRLRNNRFAVQHVSRMFRLRKCRGLRCKSCELKHKHFAQERCTWSYTRRIRNDFLTQFSRVYNLRLLRQQVHA